MGNDSWKEQLRAPKGNSNGGEWIKMDQLKQIYNSNPVDEEKHFLQEDNDSFTDRFTMTREQTIVLAKRRWDENVYCGMKMENRAVTFPQTKTILNGVNVPNVGLDDIQAILNMRDAWRYLLKTLNDPIDLPYICKIHEYIGRNEAIDAGCLRTGDVGISGTDYMPPRPKEAEVIEQLNLILSQNTSVTEKALDTFLWMARSQLFWDGNKRTAMTIANKILLMNGVGMLTIPTRYMEKFNTLLTNYYTTGKKEKLKIFLYRYAIEGIEF